MGKQIVYWITYDHFLPLVNCAVENGLCIIKKTATQIVGGKTDIVTPDKSTYYFAPLSFDSTRQSISFSACCGQVIEAGFSTIDHGSHIIHRNRVYLGTGFYNENGEYIKASDNLVAVYNKLVKQLKRIAPYTELTDMINGKEWIHKEYVCPECLAYRNDGYCLRM